MYSKEGEKYDHTFAVISRYLPSKVSDVFAGVDVNVRVAVKRSTAINRIERVSYYVQCRHTDTQTHRATSVTQHQSMHTR